MDPEPGQAEGPANREGHRYGDINIYGNAPVQLDDTYLSRAHEDSDEHKRAGKVAYSISRVCWTMSD